jgi:predicted CopG family antitoxin
VIDKIYDLLCAMKEENVSLNDIFARLMPGISKHVLKFHDKLSDLAYFDVIIFRIVKKS